MKCTFCSGEIPMGAGKMLVKSDGTVSVFCSAKCERNAKIRNPRHVKWTDTYRNVKAGEGAGTKSSKKEEKK